MNIVYIADPNAIHDVRWINFFAEKTDVKCYIIPRYSHHKNFDVQKSKLNRNVDILPPIQDPSTIRPWKNWFQVLKIKRVLVDYKIDILHILYAEPNALWANWNWYLNIPILITTRGSDILKTIPSFWKHKSLLSKIIACQYKNAFNNASRITCTSRNQIRNFNSMGVSTRIELIRTGANITFIKNSTLYEVNVVGSTKPFILMPRNMKPLYNHELTLEAIALLNDSVREGFVFVFVDCDTKDQQYFKKIEQKANSIKANIQFLPALKHNEIVALYRNATLIIMNPFSDGSPVTAMEAMACKIPLILPPLSYDPEVFGDAFTFNEWTPESLKNKVQEVLSLTKEELKQKIEINYQNVCLNGNSEVEMNKLEKIYNDLYYR